ncbi:NIPSNAP family protein [Hamadaea tsunoensis]|uniref:NIPSNAP family protein n=1 Tax=Hamadaea tsunoensis TaxID=53368 RepID=UPI000407263A|nr:NIPSNAP family protein [Hamadaea tsunoensis]
MATLEIRTYRLLPGTRTDFLHVMREQAVPLLAEFGIRVVDCGASEVDEDGHEEAYLVRAFSSADERERLEEKFYSSQQWLDGPRDGIVSRIHEYHTIVLSVPDDLVETWSR